MSPAQIALICAAVGTLCLFLGYATGHRRGVDAGWCQKHYEMIAKERERRDRKGRFCRRLVA